MPYLRQSTTQVFRFGPFLDATDGVTEEVALTITPALRRLSKDGAAFAAASGAVNATHDSDGWYSATLTTTDTDTVGELILNVQVPATHLPVWMRWWVLEEAVYDAIFGAAAALAMGSVTGAVGSVTGHTAQTGDSFAIVNGAAGLVAIDTVVDGIQTDLSNATDGLGAIKADTAAILVDTATTIPATITTAQADLDTITGAAGVIIDDSVANDTTISDAVWDEVLTGANHNISTSAGRRLRTLQTGGNYEGGQVWVDTVNGTAGTTVDESGVVTLPVDTWADALTLAAAIPLKAFHIANGSTVTLSAASDNYVLQGHEWTLALGGQSVASTMFIDADVSGTGTGTAAEFEDCIFAITSLPPMQAYNCSFTATTSGGFTMSAAGAYRFINCQSGVAGPGAPLFTLGTGAITAEFRRWSGGIQVAGISSDDVLTIGGELGTITLTGADGTVEIRGTYKAITDSRTGSPTLNLAGAILAGDVATTLADTNELQTDWADGGRLDLILDAASAPTAAAVADAVWDEAQADHVAVGSFGITASEIASILDDTDLIDDATSGLAKIATDVAAVLVDTNTTLQGELDAIQAAVITNAAGVDIAADIIAMKADTAAILIDTDVIDDATSGLVKIASDVAAVLVDTTEIGAAGVGLSDITLNAASVDAIWNEARSGHATAGTFGESFSVIASGTASGVPTTTAMVSDVGVTVDDQFKGRIIVFAAATTTAALRNQATDITACTAVSNTLTFTALTTAPASGDTFVIL